MIKLKTFSLAAALSLAFLTNAQAETLKMGINYLAAPYSYQGDAGSLVGFEIDLIQAIGKEAGFEVEVDPIVFSKSLPGLEKGEYDFVGHVYGSAEREQKYNLIHIYDDQFKFIRLKSDDASPEPLTENSKVSVISFSPQDDKLHEIKQTQLPNIEIASLDTNFLAFKNLFLKKSEVLLIPASEMNYLVENYKDYEFQTFDVPEEYLKNLSINYATTKENKALADKIAAGFEAVKSKGIYDELKKKYRL